MKMTGLKNSPVFSFHNFFNFFKVHLPLNDKLYNEREIFEMEERHMPVHKQKTDSPFVVITEIEPFMPIDDLDLTKVKEHIEYLEEISNNIKFSMYLLVTDTKTLESELSSYHNQRNLYKFPNDISNDMEAITKCLKTIETTLSHLQNANLYINGRIFLIYAIALKRAKEMWNQSYDETIAQLEIPESYRDHIITFADQVDENLNV